MQVKVGSFNPIATTGSQAVTGVGFTPKAIIFYTSFSGAGGFSSDYKTMIGFTAGAASSFAVSVASDSGVTPSNVGRRVAAKCVTLSNSDGLTISAEADLTSFDADGFTINWTTSNGVTTRPINYIALGGADLTNAKAIQWADGNALGDFSVTGVGFKPDCVLHASMENWAADGLPRSYYAGPFILGAMDKDGNQWTSGFNAADGVNPSDTYRYLYTDACFYHPNTTGGLFKKASFKSMNADGFTVNYSVNDAGGNNPRQMISLCLKGGSYKVGNAFNKGGTGKQRLDGLGFAPKGLLINETGGGDSLRNGSASHILWMLGAGDGVTQKGIALRDEDNQVTTDVGGYQNDFIINSIYVASQNLYMQASLSSLNADGFTLDWTTNPEADGMTVQPMLFLALGDTPASTTKGLKVKVSSFVQRTGVGTQAVTGVGFQPKALILYTAGNDVTGFSGDALPSLGFTTGAANSYAVGNLALTGQATTATSRSMAAKAVSIPHTAGTGYFEEADLQSFDADGFTLNWTTVTNAAGNIIVNYIALGGDDLTNAKAVQWESTSAATGEKSITGVGFKPDCVLHASSFIAAALPAPSADAYFGFGAMDKHGNQFTNGFSSGDNLNPSNTSRSQYTDAAITIPNNAGSADLFKAKFVRMGSDGFTVDFVTAYTGANIKFMSLCLKGGSYKVGNFNKAGSTGYQSRSGVGFQPKGLVISGWGGTGGSGPSTNAESFLGAASSAASVKGMNVSDQDGKTTTVAQGYQSDSILTMVSMVTASTLDGQASFASFDNNGFTLNWTTNWADTNPVVCYLAFGDSVVEDAALDAGTKVKVGSFLSAITTGPQQITGVGFRPKAVILYSVGVVGNGFSTHFYATMSFIAAGGRWSASAGADPYSPTRTARAQASRAFMNVYDAGGTSPTFWQEADDMSFDADGFSLNWLAYTSPAARVINYVAIGGKDITNAGVVKWLGQGVTGNQSVTVGFQPDIVLHASASAGGTPPSAHPGAYMATGAMDKNSGQWGLSFGSQDAASTTVTSRYQRTDRCFVLCDDMVTAGEASFVSMDSSGFTVNWAVAAGVNIFSLCLKGPKAKVGNFAKTGGAAPASQPISGVGFQPRGLVLATWGDDAAIVPAAGTAWSWGAASTTSDEKTIGLRDRDAQTTTDVQSIQLDALITKLNVNVPSTERARAELMSLDANGFTANWTTNDADATQILYLALGDAMRRHVGWGMPAGS